MRTIAIINQKGGCGKTTTAINLGGQLARAGHRTLLVDMDPQSHCAAGLGVPEHRLDMDIGDAMLMAGNRPIDAARLIWRAGRNLDLAPSRMRLAGLEAPRGGLADMPDKERRLTKVLREIGEPYDVVIVDCSPAIGLLAYNALTAADAVLIPVETSFFSLQGATKQVNTVRTMARRLGATIQVHILPTIHEESNAVANDLLQELRRRFKDKLAPVVIRRDAKLREAACFGQTIHDYAPGSPGAEDYASLARWIGDLVSRLSEPLHIAGEFIDPDRVELLPTQENDYDPTLTMPAPPSPTLSFAPANIDLPPLEGVGAAAGSSNGVGDRPMNRAEDVARRAQTFLRRVATSPAAEAGVSPAQSAPTPATPTLRLERPEPDPAAGLSPASRSLLGVRLTSQGVLFVQPLSLGHAICIAGEFNNWSPTSHPMRRNATLGIFEACIPLPPGKTYYRLVIDGAWVADAYNEQCERNPFGEPNNVVEVPPALARGA